MLFQELKVNPLILKAIKEQEYTQMTPIQEKAISLLLSGRDLLGCAQTGTGKTAAFAIPVLHALSKSKIDQDVYHPIRALVLAPTRELAIQIGESFQAYGRYLEIRTGVVFGGVAPNRSIKVLRKEPDILVATPGRLLDLMEEGIIELENVEIFVLDEADRMLDMSMIQDVQDIVSKLPNARQNMLFSATMPNEILTLSHSILKNPARVEVKSKPRKKSEISQQVYFVDEPDKIALLLHVLKERAFESVLVFTKTKKKADHVCKAIRDANIQSRAIHGDKNQSERMDALARFKDKEIQVLVATDVAARGIDVEDLSLVVNMNIPNVPETYVHRIGRTGRAGKGGTAISFCSNQEMKLLKDIERTQSKLIAVVDEHPYVLLSIALKQNREKYREKPKANSNQKRLHKASSNRRSNQKASSKKRSANRSKKRTKTSGYR